MLMPASPLLPVGEHSRHLYRILHHNWEVVKAKTGPESTLRTRGISAPTTDIASEAVLVVVVVGLETAGEEDEEEDDDEGIASTSR
jgi:hypothetical protein